MASEPQGDAFPLTRHSVVSSAQSDDPQERAKAMDAIAAAYWRPVYKYVRMRWRADREDAQDFTQDFFTRLVEKDFLNAYDPVKGRLRTFLRTCADRLFLNQERDAHRMKRGGAAIHIPLDVDEAEQELAAAPSIESPEDYFEREWARTLFTLAVERLRVQCESEGKKVHFELFERYDLSDSETTPSYAELASYFGLAITDVTNYLAFARREFRRCVLSQLRVMTGSETEFRREAQSLLGLDPK